MCRFSSMPRSARRSVMVLLSLALAVTLTPDLHVHGADSQFCGKYVKPYGYICAEYKTQTVDGYVLVAHRLGSTPKVTATAAEDTAASADPPVASSGTVTQPWDNFDESITPRSSNSNADLPYNVHTESPPSDGSNQPWNVPNYQSKGPHSDRLPFTSAAARDQPQVSSDRKVSIPFESSDSGHGSRRRQALLVGDVFVKAVEDETATGEPCPQTTPSSRSTSSPSSPDVDDSEDDYLGEPDFPTGPDLQSSSGTPAPSPYAKITFSPTSPANAWSSAASPNVQSPQKRSVSSGTSDTITATAENPRSAAPTSNAGSPRSSPRTEHPDDSISGTSASNQVHSMASAPISEVLFMPSPAANVEAQASDVSDREVAAPSLTVAQDNMSPSPSAANLNAPSTAVSEEFAPSASQAHDQSPSSSSTTPEASAPSPSVSAEFAPSPTPGHDGSPSPASVANARSPSEILSADLTPSPTPAHDRDLSPSPAANANAPAEMVSAEVAQSPSATAEDLLDSRGPPVLLMHPEFLNGDSWFQLTDAADSLLPMLLMDAGFDVWIGHQRATYWGHDHISSTPDQKSYWNWTWDEHAKYDVPALLGLVNQHTRSAVHYIGVSQSATVGAAAATMPRVSQLMRSLTLVGPTIFRGNTTSLMLDAWAFLFGNSLDRTYYDGGYQNGAFNFSSAFPVSSLEGQGPMSTVINTISGPNCCLGSAVVSFRNGWDGTTSYKNLLHYQQGVRTNSWSRFDYGVNNSLAYGGSAVPQYVPEDIPPYLPVLTIYGGQDAFAPPAGTHSFLSRLRAPSAAVLLPKYAHLDLNYSMNRTQDVFIPILNFLEKLTKFS